jgi:hypothetical protein
MRKSLGKQWLIVLASTLYLYGCSSRPDAQIQRTEAEMNQAKIEHASEFASNEWTAAELARSEAQGMLANKKNREASALLLKAQTLYSKAHELAKGRRAQAIKEITGLHNTIEIRLKQLTENVAKNSGKLPAATRNSLDEARQDVSDRVARILPQLNEGQYQEASLLAQTTLRRLWETEKDLDSALSGKKKP